MSGAIGSANGRWTRFRRIGRDGFSLESRSTSGAFAESFGASETAASLAESSARHATVLQTMADGLVTFDASGRIDSTNAAARRLLGYSEQSLLTMTVDDILPGCLDVAAAAAANPDLPRSADDIDGRRHDGTQLPLSLAIGCMRIHDRVLFSGVLRDMTEQRQADEAIRAHVLEVEAAHRKLADQGRPFSTKRSHWPKHGIGRKPGRGPKPNSWRP